MGKFQSKHASKPRQSPEGRSLASSVLRESQSSHICRRKLTENLYVELRKSTSDHNCDMKVVQPPEEEKTPDKGTNFHFKCKKETKRSSSRAAVSEGMEGNVQPGDDSQQEWTFTLYNFDNTDEVKKEDMSSLMHSVFEVLKTSVKQPCSGTRPLRIKLAVTSSHYPNKSSNTDAEQEQSGSQEAGRPMRRLFCVDENKERRKHYQDLAGIENYASKFDNADSPPLQHHLVVHCENTVHSESPQDLRVVYSLRSRSMCDRTRAERKSCRLHGRHPASWCHPTQTLLRASQSLPRRSHSRKLHSTVQYSASPHTHAGFQAQPGQDRETFYSLQPSFGVPLAQRHEHHHFHEHHHHHHHYHPS
ncbi:leucine-rich repeat-containing protein 14B isoform X2 [Maylandia zebra]|uniref:leucine-rich repeat-containing protein 14B isoform X2 n=1 Tax=Maylandia zebra TaxID=106582 RepID=UPI00403C725B